MERDRGSPRPEPLGNRSNIRRPITAKECPSVSSTVQAARKLKRRSIGNLRSRTSGTPAKRSNIVETSNIRYSGSNSFLS
ncbi:hypothetical protein DICVIV_14244 [Dictyocaulus viviparus]|uniref:Uncharacterized protein n=1 Tax=Dictyocaulus viviparus TaxID=29172 RepID=A0A0D8X888_DICVI|nr:hypothetical protein DICVIV_14244 [Dictyocaulus viviparus]